MPTFYQPGRAGLRTNMLPGDILINNNTFAPSHCGVVINGLGVIHATSKGIVEHDISEWGSAADMFRLRTPPTTAEAGRVTNIAQEIMKSAVYGMARAAFKSTFSTHTAGSGLQQRLAKYRERLRDNQGVVKNVYCSELVILSYQLACINGDKIDETNRLFIKLDGKHTWPSTLRRYLRAHIGWRELGEFKPAG